MLGGIYLGVFTPTEAAGHRRRRRVVFALAATSHAWSTFIEALIEAGVTAGMIFFVALGALIFPISSISRA